MGEYWKPVNLTRREFIDPQLSCGLKLPEWNHIHSSVRTRIADLVVRGIWSADDDIQALSDYGSSMPLQFLKAGQDLSEEDAELIYGDLGDDYLDVSTRDPQREKK